MTEKKIMRGRKYTGLISGSLVLNIGIIANLFIHNF